MESNESIYIYRGYKIVRALHPTNIDPSRMAWDVFDGDRLKKVNISTIDTAKHLIDVMIKYGYWPDNGPIG